MCPCSGQSMCITQTFPSPRYPAPCSLSSTGHLQPVSRASFEPGRNAASALPFVLFLMFPFRSALGLGTRG